MLYYNIKLKLKNMEGEEENHQYFDPTKIFNASRVVSDEEGNQIYQ